MPDYKQARIYKIVSPCGLTYYGASTQRICDRMHRHVADAKMNKGKASQRVIEAGGEIFLVEMYPCNSKKELDEREAWYIKYRSCVNEKIPGRTGQEWYQDNKEQRLANIKQYQKQPYNCECGSTVRTGDKARHFRTTKHRQWVENNQH